MSIANPLKRLRSESYQRGIVFSSLFNILSKSILFLNSILIAYYFGAQERTDIYFFVFAVTTLVAYFVGTINTSVVIPESMRIRERVGERQGMAFLNSFLLIYLGIAILITLTFLIEPQTVFGLFSKFPDEQLIEHADLLNWSIPLFGIMILTTFMSEVLTSFRFFSLPMFAQFLNNLAVMTFILLFNNSMNVRAMLLGLIIAYSFNIAMLTFLFMKELRWNFMSFDFRWTGKLKKDILYAQLGNAASFFGSFAPSYFYSKFPGVLTAFSYGQKSSLMPNDLITSQVSAVAGIRFNELFAQANMKQVNVVYTETARFLLFLLFPVSGMFFLLSEDIISFLFGHGRFTGDSISIAALFLQYMGLLLPILAISALLGRIIIAAALLRHSFWIQVASNILLVLLIYLGTRFFSYLGYPLALLLQNTLSTIAILILFHRVMPEFNSLPSIYYFLQHLLINGLITFGLYLLMSAFMADSQVVIRLFLIVSLYVLMIAGLSFAFRLNVRFNEMVLRWLKRLYRLMLIFRKSKEQT